MKRTLCISFFLMITSLTCISGQETKPKLNQNWSVSLSFAPITTFYYYHGAQNEYLDYYSKGVMEIIYPKGSNLRIDFKFNNRLSFSSGLNFKVVNDKYSTISIGEFSARSEKSTDDKYILEIPIQINYQIIKSPKFFNPYLKTGFRNSYFKRFYIGEYTLWDYSGTTNGKIDNKDSKYIMFYELGAGTFLNLSRSISFIIESNLTYSISGFGYFELQGGLRYSFK